MTENEFNELKALIARKLFELEHLQEVYRRETGKEFVREIELSPNWERETTNRPIWARAGGNDD